MRIETPRSFHFLHAVTSHGWVQLVPNRWDAASKTVTRIERLASGKVVGIEIRGGEALEAAITHVAKLAAAEKAELSRKIAHMFRLDEDFNSFYAQCRKRGGHWRKATRGFGRLLRSPTVFEDVVKVICTTNVQWGGTKGMVARLVENYGAPYPADATLRAFPTPEAIAAAEPGVFDAAVRMGYRAPYVRELATRIADGELDLEAFVNSPLPTPELRKRLLAIKGIGAYAAGTLLMLLGRYDALAVDSVCRTSMAELHFDGRPPADAEIHALYEDWSEWRFLACWFDIWLLYETKKRATANE